jgi:hypothetical protein
MAAIVVHTYNLSYDGGIGRRTEVRGQFWAKAQEVIRKITLKSKKRKTNKQKTKQSSQGDSDGQPRLRTIF